VTNRVRARFSSQAILSSSTQSDECRSRFRPRPDPQTQIHTRNQLLQRSEGVGERLKYTMNFCRTIALPQVGNSLPHLAGNGSLLVARGGPERIVVAVCAAPEPEGFRRGSGTRNPHRPQPWQPGSRISLSGTRRRNYSGSASKWAGGADCRLERIQRDYAMQSEVCPCSDSAREKTGPAACATTAHRKRAATRGAAALANCRNACS